MVAIHKVPSGPAYSRTHRPALRVQVDPLALSRKVEVNPALDRDLIELLERNIKQTRSAHCPEPVFSLRNEPVQSAIGKSLRGRPICPSARFEIC